ncbi:DUF551 domain-containing protein [Escherichia coli]|nr:DUF551 domain-containing protein [Escherichia coli]
MSTITRELAKLFRKITNSEIDAEGNAHVVLSPADSLLINNARIALASLEAEPVAYMVGTQLLENMTQAIAYKADTALQIKPLYTAPPAPVSVPAAMEIDDDFDSAFEHGKAVGWNAYRAAMLQAEPVSNLDELPLDYLQGQKDGLEWAAHLAEANHPHTGDWLYDDPVELAKAIRKGPDMPELKSVPADADDNFYSWFCREWEQHYQPNGYSLSAKKHLGAIAESAWFACRAAMLQGADGKPELTVWYGSMPESNGKANWTAILHRKGEGRCMDGFTIDRSEYPGRVLYAADRVRYLIGEKSERPSILDYDADAHSGYVKPGNSPVIPDGWVACSERMPDIGTEIFYFCQDDGMRDCGIVSSSNFSGKGDAELYVHAEGYDLRFGVDISHWMPLPAAPQQEVNRG